MRRFKAFLTNNGNIAVTVREESAQGSERVIYNAFITSKWEWLRECSINEFSNIEENAMFEVVDMYMMQESFDTIMPEKAPTWEFMGSIRVEEDFSSYKPETCNNGGDYAFYTSLDVYFTTINGKAVIRGVTRYSTSAEFEYSTSAEFEYDELNGSFQTNVTDCQVLNAEQLRYYTQGYDTCFLEQISQVYKLEDVHNLTCKVMEKDEDNIVARLITAGAQFAPVKKSRRG